MIIKALLMVEGTLKPRQVVECPDDCRVIEWGGSTWAATARKFTAEEERHLLGQQAYGPVIEYKVTNVLRVFR